MIFSRWSKDQLEARLYEERNEIEGGNAREENPLDVSDSFRSLCEACRRGDLKVCQEMISAGANISARDIYDYTPLILASLCGHYEVVQLLLESGALCERDTFQGERCLYNALNDRIRNLLLEYDYSKSLNPLQPYAAHITSLLTRDNPNTSDIIINVGGERFHLHKFILSTRCPYFRKRLSATPEIKSLKLPSSIPPQAFEAAVRYLYLGELALDLGGGPGTGYTEQEILLGLDKLTKHLEIDGLWDSLLQRHDRRLATGRRRDETANGRDQIEEWFLETVLNHKFTIDPTTSSDEVRWDWSNAIFADVLLRADPDQVEENTTPHLETTAPKTRNAQGPLNGVPVKQLQQPAATQNSGKSTLFPTHRAILLRSEYFLTMFSSAFLEAQQSDSLKVISIDCSPEVLEIILKFLYTEKADFPLRCAVDVLFAADLLFIEKLKVKAAQVISTLGNGDMSAENAAAKNVEDEELEESLDIYEVIRAGWLTRVQRLEEFGARYIANRLEDYIDEEDFAELIRESATRITARQETDSIELLDDIRYYLSERFRLRFEDAGLDYMMSETGQVKTAEGEEIPRSEQDPSSITIPGDQKLANDMAISGAFRTLDGEVAGDEFASDALNYRLLLGKIDDLLEKLKLDA